MLINIQEHRGVRFTWPRFTVVQLLVGVMRSSAGDKGGNFSRMAHMLCKKFYQFMQQFTLLECQSLVVSGSTTCETVNVYSHSMQGPRHCVAKCWLLSPSPALSSGMHCFYRITIWFNPRAFHVRFMVDRCTRTVISTL